MIELSQKDPHISEIKSVKEDRQSKIPGDNVVWAEYNEKTLDIFFFWGEKAKS